ncbi:ATP-binding protein [Roseateles agri]|uniref:ATP-binding protein n=1 Tax=Roseateles agri TaxID=3098619 RepID=UPI003D673996
MHSGETPLDGRIRSNDAKGKDVLPGKLQETFVAFANADGGDIYLGIEDKKHKGNRVRPFAAKEDANSFIHVLLEQTNPTVEGVVVELLHAKGFGHILHLSIPKSPKVHYTASGDCFVRANAGKIKIKGERVTALAYSKGAVAYERTAVRTVTISEMVESPNLHDYMTRVQSSLEKTKFLRKQRLLAESDKVESPNVCCALLFDEEPQATWTPDVRSKSTVSGPQNQSTSVSNWAAHLPLLTAQWNQQLRRRSTKLPNCLTERLTMKTEN